MLIMNKLPISGPIVHCLKQFNELANFKQKNSKHFETLSHREKQVLMLVAEGYSNMEIADKMNISRPTVQNYRSNIRNKLLIDKESDYLKYALSFELISLF